MKCGALQKDASAAICWDCGATLPSLKNAPAKEASEPVVPESMPRPPEPPKPQAAPAGEALAGRLVRTLEGHIGVVWSVAYSPDGRLIASCSDDGTVKLWDAASGKLLRGLGTQTELGEVSSLGGPTDRVCSVAYSPDGQFIASGSNDKTVKLWDAASGRLIRTFEGHEDWGYSVAYSPDGRFIASGSKDATVKIWE
jgi:WD40 repeat protein